jgi:hypothetical protein
MFTSICFPNLKKNPITLQIHIISVISIDTAPYIVMDLKGNFFVRKFGKQIEENIGFNI